MLRGWPLFVSWVFMTWMGGEYCRAQETTANPPASPVLPVVLEAPVSPVLPAAEAPSEISPASPGPTWLTSLEVGYVRPNLAGKGTQPGVDLHWVPTPTISLGYQLGAIWFLDFTYRYLASQNDETGPGGIIVHDGLDSHLFDLDVGIASGAAPKWSVEGRFGIRIAKLFFDSRIDNGAALVNNSSDFWGGGPHLNLAAVRRIDDTPLALVIAGEWAGLIGNNELKSGENAGTLTQTQHGRWIDQLSLRTGLRWDVSTGRWWMRLTAGYQLELWSHVIKIPFDQAVQEGRLTDGNAVDTLRDHGDLIFHGPFLRAEIRY